MKKFYTLIITCILLVTVYRANAQDEFSQLIKSTPADATKLVGAYAEPLFKGFGTGLNSGWNNTAKTKKFLHFDLRITVAGAFVPSSDKSFDVNSLGLSSHVTVDKNSPTAIAPTIGGDKNAATPLLDVNNDNGQKISSFSLPTGKTSVIPAPNIQLTIGLLKNTDITIRTVPTIKISDDIGSVGMIGFGIKHDIIQDFAGGIAKKLIPFDLALAVNYNRINYTKTLSVKPDAGTVAAPGQSSDFSNQRIEAHFTGVNVAAIISKKLLFFTPFLSVAYQSASTDLGVLGNYPLTSTATGLSTFYTTVTDPVHINETSISGLRTDIGFQLNLAVFRVYASVSAGKYASGNAGIGFGF